MKILLDPQIFNSQKYGGISRYYTEIFSILSKKPNVYISVPLYATKNVYFNGSSLVTESQERNLRISKILSFFGISERKRIKKLSFERVIKSVDQEKFDLFIPTYYNPYFLECIDSKPFVLTVYDMISELFPAYFLEDTENTIENKYLLMERAAKIIAVSENTKRDIIKLYPKIDSNKIVVIYHGCSIKIDVNIKVDLPSKYILFVGERKNYKGFHFMVNSIKEMLLANSELFLVCAGGGSFSKVENDFIVNLGLKKKIIQRNFKEKELNAYYKNAVCFVFPSMYEGFGIPVLESMVCGCPIVLTNSSSFPEVAGNAGIYFESNNSEDLKSKIEKVMNDNIFRSEYIQKGFIQAQKFTWNDAAEKCYKLYCEVVNEI
ncbi:glycosyltransferase family 4 protein [Flavobacterium sp. HJJ]|uniref:glycosyltransferase family 4 protein n=1 Tax=Flavobacterium sp. HJJ TaxID=2783792 RepID=UPI00188AF88C|nr:glycosyltransferase family 1 protein [Flavobacterium sp. HJJ]MBF4472476.1 glycosyltransferase family 4 protein [Flavobacterium sp. HJJ]